MVRARPPVMIQPVWKIIHPRQTLQIVSIDQNKPLSISLKVMILIRMINNLSDSNRSFTRNIVGFDKTSGYLTYMPTSGFKGQDRLNFKVVDSHGAESNNGLIVIRANATSSSPSSLPSYHHRNPHLLHDYHHHHHYHLR